MRIDPMMLNTRTSSGRTVKPTGGGLGMPNPDKFRSGYLPPSAIPVSRVIHNGNDSSGSDMATESDDDDVVYGGRYSIDSSPQDERGMPSSDSNFRSANRSTLSGQRRESLTSEYTYSDVNSSVDLGLRRGNGNGVGVRGNGVGVRENGGVGRGRREFMEDEESDSGGSGSSSEFSSLRTGSGSKVGHGIGTANGSQSKVYGSESYGSSVTSKLNVESVVAAAKVVGTPKMQNVKHAEEDDTPSAPPFSTSGQETNLNTEPISATKADTGISVPDSGCSLTNNEPSARIHSRGESAGSSGSHPARVPTFHASTLGPWHSVLSYDACVRLCLNAWARGCMEAPVFLENECSLLRSAFGLQNILLQSEEEIMTKRPSELAAEGAAQKPKKMIGKMKVQVRKVKMGVDPHPPTGCSMTSLKTSKIKMEAVRNQLSNIQTKLGSGWQALRRVRFVVRKPAEGSLSRKSLAYLDASTHYLKQVSGLMKVGVTTLRSSSTSYDAAQAETYSCLLRLKSMPEEDAIRMQLGSAETHVFFPDGLGDDLIVEVQDSKGKNGGRVLAQVATIADDPSDKLRWWSIYHEPEHELVGKLQLFINFSTSYDENSHLKCGSVAETVAYDLALEVAMKVQHFQQRHLLLHGEWKWLLEEFASYYGVSDTYTKLRYLSYVMDVATPTADCLTLVYDLLYPVTIKGCSKKTLSHQENRILGEVEEQIEQILALVFENYKSLDESLSSGMMDVFRPATGHAAPALQPAVKLYTLLHDVLTPESQTKLCRYFQAASKKRSKRHLTETDEFVTMNTEGTVMDKITVSTAYQKMKVLCLNLRNEIFTDIEIHNQHILPSFLDLPNLSASIYSVELCNRIREFLISCPPTGPSPPVAELVVATADFQRDLAVWNINPIKGGVDAKELFHLYIVVWIKDKRAAMLEKCKLDKVKWSGVRTQHATTPFVDDMYERLKETLTDYEVIICRWPEYTFVLENAIADIEKAVVESLDKQYMDVLSPLKENLNPKKFGLKYIQKLTMGPSPPYVVPDDLGILLNSLKRMLDTLRPKLETQFKSWGSCIRDGGNQIPGERLSEVTVMLRAKFRNYVQCVVEKLVENTRMQNATKLKKILQDSKETVGESDIRNRMQPLKEQLTKAIDHLHSVFATQVFVAICRGFWDRMGQDVLSFLENRKENKSWYKGCRMAVSILDDTFASQMQQLLGNALLEKDIEPPRSITEVRSMLCKDAQVSKNNTYYF